MFEDKIRKNLKADEELILLVRKYVPVFLMPILCSTVCIIAPFFFLYPLWHWGPWGIAIFFAVLLGGIFLSVRTIVIYSLNVFVITSQRIIDIDQAGLFDRTVSETTYNKIQDVSIRIKGVWQTVLHYGSIIIQTAGNQANIELMGVKNPEKLQQLITEVQKDAVKDQGMTAADIAALLASLQQSVADKHNQQT
jgi:membrane protein YdbS with pleckstrin-like domain